MVQAEPKSADLSKWRHRLLEQEKQPPNWQNAHHCPTTWLLPPPSITPKSWGRRSIFCTPSQVKYAITTLGYRSWGEFFFPSFFLPLLHLIYLDLDVKSSQLTSLGFFWLCDWAFFHPGRWKMLPLISYVLLNLCLLECLLWATSSQEFDSFMHQLMFLM